MFKDSVVRYQVQFILKQKKSGCITEKGIIDLIFLFMIVF